MLNFGHTIGHAVEAASGYSLLHGFAVAIGMCAVADLAARCGYASAQVKEEIAALLRAYGLPTAVPQALDRERIATFMQADKKSIGRRLFFVLPTALGQVKITDEVDPAALAQVLAGHDAA